MRWLAVVVLAGTACYSPRNNEACHASCTSATECPDGLACEGGLCRVAGSSCTPGDGPFAPDMMLLPDDPISGAVCAGGQGGALDEICIDPPPIAENLDGQIFNTDTDPRCRVQVVNGVSFCLVVVDRVTVNQRFVGNRGLVLWSGGTLDIKATGIVDVSSTGMSAGAGGAYDICATTTSNGAFDASRLLGSGGAGGTTGVLGGDGGSILNTNGGFAQGFVDTTGVPYGGCNGGKGGADNLAEDKRGLGGGVAYLMAHTKVVITGVVNASGGGARAAASPFGGAGGGSGGTIVIDAPRIELPGVAIALGGSGASGASSTTNGIAGNDPTLTSPFAADKSGTVAGCPSAFGGAGGSGDNLPASNGGLVAGGSSPCSGGGGGGGDGVILLFSPVQILSGGDIKPAPP